MSSKSKQNKQAHPTMSFQQIMAKAQLDALKPYIAEEIEKVRRTLATQYLAAIGDVTTRLTVIERVLIGNDLTNETVLNELRRDEEDTAYGIKKVSDGAAENDYVRTVLQASFVEYDAEGKDLGGKAFPEQELDIPRLTPDAQQAHPKILEALIGMTEGQEKDITYELKSPRGTAKVSSHVKVLRVSRKPATEEATNAQPQST